MFISDEFRKPSYYCSTKKKIILQLSITKAANERSKAGVYMTISSTTTSQIGTTENGVNET